MNASTKPILRNRNGQIAASYQPMFLSRQSAASLYDALVSHRSSFKSGFMLVGDRWVKTPRLVVELGDDEHVFADSGPNGSWFDEVRILRDETEIALSQRFNYAIVNWYRNGDDFTGWHSDKMELHAPMSSIAMVSVGLTRCFEFREEESRRVVSSTQVEHGSLLVMRPESQVGYEHSLRPDSSAQSVRISITLRNVLPTPSALCPNCSAVDVPDSTR